MHPFIRTHWVAASIVALVGVTSPAAGQTTGSLELLVREAGTARPLADASVRIIATGQFTFTDPTGHTLLLGVPEGRHSVEVRHLGHAPRMMEMEFEEGSVTQVQMALEIDPFELERIEVRGEQGNARLRRAGFYHRQRSNGFGTFIGEEEVERRRHTTNRLSDLLYGVRGLAINYEYGVPILVAPRGARNCRPSIYIDGIRIGTTLGAVASSPQLRAHLLNVDHLIPVSDIAAVEVYTGTITTPLEFGMGLACGAVVIWTRSGA